MTDINTGFNIVDMNDSEPNKPKQEKKFITVPSQNTDWKCGKTKKGEKTLYRKYNGSYVNIGFFKSKHVYVTYNNSFIKDHNLKYVDDLQIQNDVDEMLKTLVILE